MAKSEWTGQSRKSLYLHLDVCESAMTESTATMRGSGHTLTLSTESSDPEYDD
jgi:hypothetical protein